MIQREKLRLHTSSWHKETILSHKLIHKKHLISQLKDYSVEPYEKSSAIYVTTGQEINFSWFKVCSKLQS